MYDPILISKKLSQIIDSWLGFYYGVSGRHFAQILKGRTMGEFCTLDPCVDADYILNAFILADFLTGAGDMKSAQNSEGP